ncbi:hypothetical protein D3C84_688570 [compost metagenome]
MQGKVLEGQGRAVEQLQHPLVAVQLTQRRNRCVGEHAVGFFKDFLEIGIRNAAGDERAHHPEGQLVIRQASPGSDFFLGETWQVFRHIEAAIAGQAGEQHIFKIQGRRLAAGTDITHGGQTFGLGFKLQATSYKLKAKADSLLLAACSLPLTACS